ncbi:MAG TPA: bacteriohopanetetrol glucosamine biosynthesis glycosyltransferase HpnI [Candidatus Binataceae bacterium]|nr:bacteriohopanetetrol glucosamine biosynthesis glycosyltransferase HpnI [Candidatus Binataceae bacterium]
MIVLTIIAAIGVVISVSYYIAASLAAMRFALRAASPVPPLPKIPPRVAIMKPLRGMTDRLAANLMSFLEVNYPRAEYVFGVASYEDPAVEVAAMLKPQYRFAPVAIVVGEEPVCANRKVAKLIRMSGKAERADVFVISDADISVERDYLRRIIGELYSEDDIGVVTCLYRARPHSGLSSRLEALSINTDFAPMVMLSSVIEPIRYALGATMAIRRSAVEDIGGLRAIKDLLADDFFLGRLATDKGWKVRLSSSLVTLVPDERSFEDFWNRQLRWARTYRTTRPASIATIVTHGPFWAILLMLGMGLHPWPIAIFLGVIGLRLGMAALLLRYVLKLPELTRETWLVPFKDLFMTGVWFASLVSNEVKWRGRRLKILADGRIQEVIG